MYKVEGKILVKESQVKISNLQVVLYDLDNPPVESVLQTYFKKFLCLDYEQQSAPTFWQQFPGNRLGSVLTDSDGEFKFEFDRKEFQGSACEQSPDLILLVLAPEDTILDQAGIPRPLPPNERIMHYSYETVIDSGKQESYIIRLPKELLERFQIPYPILFSQPVKLAKENIKADLQESAELRANIKEAIIEQTRENARPSIALKQKTDKAFRNFSLSSVSEDIRAKPTYLNPDDNLAVQQQQLFTQAITDIPKIDETAGVERRLRLRLTETQLQNVGLSVDSDGVVHGKADGKKILGHVKKSVNLGALEFINPIASTCKQLEAERRFIKAMECCESSSNDECDNSTPSTENSDSEDTLDDAFIKKQIAEQMRYVTAPEVELSYGVEQNDETIANPKKAGPTDVTSYHDFHELQIAFDYIWKEAFDNSITELIKGVHSEIVRYSNQVSGVPEEFIERINDPIASVTDMKELYANVSTLQEIINNEVEEPVSLIPLPHSVRSILDTITEKDWKKLDPSEVLELIHLAGEIKGIEETKTNLENRDVDVETRKNEANSILKLAKARPDQEAPSQAPRQRTKLNRLMEELDQRLSERHKFDIFAPNSINYGMMLTYRQAWTPKDYQVGDLVSTIPLAPKEVRRYSKKRIIKKSRSQKELEDSQSSGKSESSSTSRAESEIVKRATNKTSFQQTAEGSVGIAGIAQGRFGTQFGVDAEKASSNTKKNFNEAVSKAAQEYKQQHRLEVETSTSEEFENTDSGEISNPNDEITVTYLFYELQRQYAVKEQIHRLSPVILVANEVPEPHQIDEDWLITNHWILRRVILDDMYLPALDYITASSTGDTMAVEIMLTNVQRQAALVDELTQQLKSRRDISEEAFRSLQYLMNPEKIKELDGLTNTGVELATAPFKSMETVMATAAFGPLGMLAGLFDNGEAEVQEKREEGAKFTLDRADKDLKQVGAKFSSEVVALHAAIDKYTAALRTHFDRQTAIAALRIHVKENILCYMHRIWDHECSDQRFFRLYNIEIPWLIETETFDIPYHQNQEYDEFRPIPEPGTILMDFVIPFSIAQITTKKLSQVADLDNLLGYKGNYMIFPVKEPNQLHSYMMQDYIDPDTKGLRDPDEFSNYSVEDLLKYACCLKNVNNDEFDETLQQLETLIKERMASPRDESETIIVPTDSLYIEALPGKHPVLEDFKLTHRAIDVKKVQAEVRHDELENVRLAARLMHNEREDPDVEKKIVVEGGDDIIVSSES